MSKQVGGTIRDLNLNALSGIPVVLELVAAQGFVTSSDASLAGKYQTVTGAAGTWSAVVNENDLIDPVGTLYRVTEKIPNQYGGTRTYLIQVLSSLGGGTNQVHDLLVPELSPVGEINQFLTKAYADATYATIGASGSAGPAGPTGPAGGTSLPISYTLEATLLADSPSDGTIGYAQDSDRFFGRINGAWKYILVGKSDEELVVSFTPGGNTDATTTGAFVDWIALGNFVVPSWALRAHISLELTGILMLTTANTLYSIRAVLDTANSVNAVIADPNSLTPRFVSSIEGEVTGFGTGSKALKIQALRVSGTGQMRADATSRFTGRLRFFP